MKVPLAVSQTVVVGDALQWNGGYLEVGTTASTDIRFVAMEDVTTTDAQHTECLVCAVEGVEFKVEADEAVAVTYRGDYVALATKATVDADNSGAKDCFYIRDFIGTVDVTTTVVGHFVHAVE